MNTGVLQSGSITPGHLAVWTTTGVIQDGGPATNTVLASLRSADFNSTSDQPILLPQKITAFQITGIIITNSAVSLTTAVGGFYPVVSKGGSPLVSAAQAYSALSSLAALMQATLTSFAQQSRLSAANLTVLSGQLAIYLSLTTPQGINAIADIYLLGTDLT